MSIFIKSVAGLDTTAEKEALKALEQEAAELEASKLDATVDFANSIMSSKTKESRPQTKTECFSPARLVAKSERTVSSKR